MDKIKPGKDSQKAARIFQEKCRKPKFVFTLSFEKRDYNGKTRNVNKITCYFHYKDGKLCCAVQRQNTDYEVSYVGRVFEYCPEDEQDNMSSFNYDKVRRSLECRICYMSRGILPCKEYFEKIKEFRKQDIWKYKKLDIYPFYQRLPEPAQRQLKKNISTGILELNETAKRYIIARERCIKGKIIMFCVCLGMFDVRVPTEMWIKILSFTDFVI